MTLPIDGLVVDLNILPLKFFLDGFGNPRVTRNIAGTRAPRLIDCLEGLRRQPKILAIQRTNRLIFRRIEHAMKLAPFWRHVQYVLYMFR
ncbi:hypothetical protein [Methylocystis rosea]|uniref:hypothetical protein n=1 Tax=Methylocystis rosea TaxID=173366 RepID=UPI0012EB4F43|nr:hypothetical protein [Methylocystis rosea]